MKCSRSSFWDFIRNLGYCDKIRVPKFKDEAAQLVDGQHEPLISESLFYKVQDILDGRKRQFNTKKGAKAVLSRSLALRGFLICPKCNELLTGSASKGRKNYYHYYHCKSACGIRFKTEPTNILFERMLKQFVPKPGMAELFQAVVCDSYYELKTTRSDCSRTVEIVTEQNNRITKARELLLTDIISGQEYQNIKAECENLIVRAEAELKRLNEETSEDLDIEGLATLATSNLQKLPQFYA